MLRPGGTLLVAFDLGTGTTLKTEGYGGHPMRVSVHRRTAEQVAASLRQAGFTIDLDLRLEPDDPKPGGVLIAVSSSARGRGPRRAR